MKQLQHDGYDRKKRLPRRYVLFVDLSEAFDRVVHEILVRKMIAKGVPYLKKQSMS
jgi:hypothetical protein